MKYKYYLNNKNQLVIKHREQKTAIPVRGSFSVDKNNQLIYWLNEPENWRRQYKLPPKISFIGNWRLNSNYDLELSLDEAKEEYKGGSLVLKGEIISTDRDALAFQIITQDKQGASHIQILKLNGRWKADEFNRINFLLKKKAAPDILIFAGNWEINRNQQITYNYEKTKLKTKTKTSHTLTFEGFWQISSANRIVYILTHSNVSRFDFRVQIESPNLYPQEGLIKYRLGMGLRKIKPSATRLICLYGAWKFSRKAGLIFQMDYGNGELKNIEFGANLFLHKKDEVVLSLANKKHGSLDFTITFTRRFLKQHDAEVFLRLKDTQQEKGIQVGLRLPF